MRKRSERNQATEKKCYIFKRDWNYHEEQLSFCKYCSGVTLRIKDVYFSQRT